MNVAYITDSFPPIVDGVSRCVVESAEAFKKYKYGKCAVVTPYMPDYNDFDYPFPVFRFPSLKLPKMDYRFGYPFVPALARNFKKMNIEIIHAHSPFTALSVARQLRDALDIPIVYTQHTKWEFDIARAVAIPAMRKPIEKILYKNINAADDVWAVSKKTGEHMTERGFKGEYTVMENGTEFLRSPVNESLFKDVNQQYKLDENVPFLLFVGRMMWYKNQKLTFDALEILKNGGFDFKMVFIGDGRDLSDMKKYIHEKNMHEQVFFAGRINDRELLRAYYTRADMFIFPSTYDNAPLVIREAAAGSCPSLVIRGSSASEILEENETAFFASETPESIAESIAGAFGNRELYERVRKNAADRVYLPWTKVIENSIERYSEVRAGYESRKSKKKRGGANACNK